MNNSSINTHEMKREIAIVADSLSKGLSKPTRKFVSDFLYGLHASGSTLISDISRSLKEKVKLISTIERLCDNLQDLTEAEKQIIMNNYYQRIENCFEKEVIAYIDDSDIIKTHGQQFEDLGYVRDGSSKQDKVEKGYQVASVVALSTKEKQPIPIYNHIYSSKSKGFVSKNEETIKSMDACIKALEGKKITFVGDRGYDANVYYKACYERDVDYIMRVTKTRSLIFKKKQTNAHKMAVTRKGKVKMELYFQKENKTVYASHTRVILPMNKAEVTLVIVYGLKEEEPMLLLTNKKIKGKEDLYRVVRGYMNRWRIEEYFRYIKQSLGYENMRVRTLKAMNAESMFVLLQAGHVGMLAEKINEKLLVIKIIERSRSIKNKVYFWYYQIGAGIREILKYATTGIEKYQEVEKRKRYKQMQLKL